ncbi:MULTISPECIES: phosphatase PAP2 family protein [Paraburkholderia]|jgi:membrane-associated phospholipid phosphatase|uniref:Phosphatase PAP2 family protein n=1 Tax=Paraburkholderia strydomiana TaxID=1245417 RepID=A0ABW9C123_9BURK|nr:phosphatase PAP2 family protein [Paraburkholderia caledonica]CAH2902644.1 MAG: Membrane-associated phospholipid phosphatase [uncultured Paraburkholderia sp.]CAH2937511.1 MAG: Membrane-associated phospholipid phosphatase [uncultured Paraburkholderia sp.]
MWTVFTNIGDAAVTLPVAAVCACWIALFNVKLAFRWIVMLSAGIAIVGASKIFYAGWGISFPASHFRVISGHAMLSTCVWMVALALQLKWWRLPPSLGIAAGMGIGALTGVSRLMDLSHTLPEVIAGWILGAIVGLMFLRKALSEQSERARPAWLAASLLFVCALAYGHQAPLQRLIETRSPQIHSHAHSIMALAGRVKYRIQTYEGTLAR